jgi:hypothetical protein
MKMVKSLLLGSAAGLVAVTAGQAADLPVKAKPVEYVKVCGLYGAGFYYMPGTDLCIKIGGWVRAEAVYGGGGSVTWGPFNGVSNVRSTNNTTVRNRGYITADAREQTAYGTARGYIAVGVNTSDTGINTAANTFSSNRAFVQWAGFTGGLTQSFYDFYSGPAATYRAGYLPMSDTGDPGWAVFGYTAQLGNGVTATISAEQRRMTQIINVDPSQALGGFYGLTASTAIGSIGGVAPGAYQTGSNLAGVGSNSTDAAVFPGVGAYAGFNSPDIVGNLRLDQTWGGVQAMGALHEVNAVSYGIAAAAPIGTPGTPSMTSGHPGDQWGYAVGAGLRLNFPMVAQGDYFQSQVNYTQGALRYLFFTPNSNWGAANNSHEAYGVLSDAVYGSTAGTAATGTQLNLTTAWGVNASFEHYWTPQWHESFYGEYSAVSYNTQANNSLCALENSTTNGGPGAVAGATGTIATLGCNNNWSTFGLGTRLQWDVTKTFYLGVEAMYEQLDTAKPNSTGALSSSSGATGVQGVGITGSTVASNIAGTAANEHDWNFTFRAHKDFLP